jgi:hypothetical protein
MTSQTVPASSASTSGSPSSSSRVSRPVTSCADSRLDPT